MGSSSSRYRRQKRRDPL
ncbi:hypothetical protein D041_0290A, partial [Vibrio parahaemolyticus EKP-008]